MRVKRFAVSAFLCLIGIVAEAQNVGIGQLNPVSKLDISGNFSVGANYSGLYSAPVNGLLVEGATVIGNSVPINSLDKFECYTLGANFGINSYHYNSLNGSAAVYSNVSGTNGTGILVDHTASAGYGATINISSASATASIKGDANANGPHGVFGEYTGSGPGSALYANGRGLTTASWQTTSDARLKEKIMPLNDGLKTIVQLMPVTYLYKPELAAKYNFETRPQIGFLAQDLEKVLPEMVYEATLISVSEKTREKSTPEETLAVKTVNYSALIPVLTKAIQEQQIQIEALQQSVKSLQAEIIHLKP